MKIYFAEVSLPQGFDILGAEDKHSRLVQGRRINRPGGWNLFSRMEGRPIRCWHCGCEADRWISEKGRNDHQGHPDLNLYASGEQGIVLMTRDHIIPKSLGGTDDWRNMRPGCDTCNGNRGNHVNPEDIAFAKAHPELISQERIDRGMEGMLRNLKTLREQKKDTTLERAAVRKPFEDMGYL
jgi:hypothetical protein